ncbi:MAG TPA: response regulator transcription factor [Bdellovibrionota bacterium]|jgi:DNA-binding response OmpR family regulator|nr:response regulator transcription factor [Bdellovibrionota bacterium]
MPESPFQRALLVEDEKALGQALQVAVQELGIVTRLSRTLAEARASFEKGEPDLLVLDRTLPDGDGLTLCRELRERGFAGAVLMLTARGAATDRVDGLDAGADDYLPKPFSWDELAARVRALARRVPFRSGQASSEGPWAMDDSRLRIMGPLGWVALKPLEFKLARCLIEAEGKILGRDDLLRRVWGFTLIPKTRTVDHFMGRLRKRFESDPEQPRHFQTVRGAGYRFQR